MIKKSKKGAKMNLLDLQNKLYEKIPITKMMGFEILSFDKYALLTRIPLDLNINDKGTAFGGSLSSFATISAWVLLELLINEHQDNHDILVVSSLCTFKAPLTSDINCTVFTPPKEELLTLREKLSSKGIGSIKVNAQISEVGELCFDYEGKYAVRKKE